MKTRFKIDVPTAVITRSFSGVDVSPAQAVQLVANDILDCEVTFSAGANDITATVLPDGSTLKLGVRQYAGEGALLAMSDPHTMVGGVANCTLRLNTPEVAALVASIPDGPKRSTKVTFEVEVTLADGTRFTAAQAIFVLNCEVNMDTDQLPELAEISAGAAAGSAAAAAASETAASNFKTAAQGYANSAQASATDAAASRDDAAASKTGAQAAQGAAAASATAAGNYAVAALSAQNASAASANDATTQAANAAASKGAASNSAAAAAISEGNAKTSETNAAASAAGALASKNAANTSAANAAASEANALSYKNAAATSASNAATSEANAAASAATVTTRVSTVEIEALFTREGYVSASGNFTPDTNWRTTDRLRIDQIAVYAIKLYGHTSISSIAFYDSTGAFISSTVAASIGSYITAYPTPPGGAVYVSFTCNFQSSFLALQQVSIGATNKTSERVGFLEISRFFTKIGYISTSGVPITTDSNWAYTDFIEIAKLTVGRINLYGVSAACTIAFYDANKIFISGITGSSSGQFVTAYPTPPGGAVYVVFTCNRQAQFSAFQTFSVQVVKDNPDDSTVDVDYAKYATQSGYITTTGTMSSPDSNWLRSDYLPVSPGDAIRCYMIGHTAVNVVSFYTSGKAFISGQNAAANPPASGSLVNQVVTAPAGAAYVKVSYANPAWVSSNGVVSTAYVRRDVFASVTDLDSRVSALTSPLPATFSAMRKLELQPTDKVLLYGDSISSTDYPWYQSAMAALTGATVYNGGFSGRTAAQLAQNAQLQRIWDYGARLVIALLGGNDNGAAGTVGTFSGAVSGEPVVTETDISTDYAGTYFIQAVSHIIRKFKSQYSNIRARAGLTGTETEAEKTAKIDAVLKPVLVFCTTLPQKRNNSSDAFSQAANWKRKRDAVIECCAKYNVHCVDLNIAVPFDMTVEPYWVSPTDTTTNNGVYYMDGLHPNKYGFQIISEIICAQTGI